MLMMMLIAQIAATTTAVPSDQDRVTTTEVFDYAEWRICALKETHRGARAVADHEKIADMAMAACAQREAAYRSSLLALGQAYKLANPADFARRNGDEASAGLRILMTKELK